MVKMVAVLEEIPVLVADGVVHLEEERVQVGLSDVLSVTVGRIEQVRQGSRMLQRDTCRHSNRSAH